jgi:hypothetical protein
LGSLFPLAPAWNIRTTGIENRKSLCMIIPDRLLSKQRRLIGITVLIEYDLRNLSYDEFAAEKRSAYPVIEQTELTIGSHNYNVFIFEDKSVYQNMGGAKGLYITTNIQYRENNNIGIELPIEFNFNNSEGNEGISYYTLTNYFYRVNQGINIGILVDSSNEIYEEAFEFICNYLERVIFE